MSEYQHLTRKEAGWVVGGLFYVSSYGIPVLVWYNAAAFPWTGVILMDATLVLFGWAYILWLRIFIFAAEK
jgi:hypothetical protein